MTNAAFVTPFRPDLPHPMIVSVRTVEALPERVRAALLDRTVLRRFSRNAPIFWQGDRLKRLVVMVEGHAKLQRNTESGREVVIDVVGPGDPVAWDPTLNADCVDESLVALEPCQVAFLPAAPVRMALSTVPSCALAYAAQTAAERRSLTNQIAATRAASVPSRLGGLLLYLLESRGDAETGRIPVRLTRQDLADGAGTTVETAIRLMRRWEADGLLESRRNGVIVHDAAGLRNAIDGS